MSNRNAVIVRRVFDLRVNMKARGWCTLRYPGHPHGCPNYNKRKTCPPQAPLIFQYFDLDGPLWLVAIQFDLAAHMARMKAKEKR